MLGINLRSDSLGAAELGTTAVAALVICAAGVVICRGGKLLKRCADGRASRPRTAARTSATSVEMGGRGSVKGAWRGGRQAEAFQALDDSTRGSKVGDVLVE